MLRLISEQLDGLFISDVVVSKELNRLAKANNIVVSWVYGGDLWEFRGAIYDEIEIFGNTKIVGVSPQGEIIPTLDCHVIRLQKTKTAWTISPSFPCLKFCVYEHGNDGVQLFCEGVVFNMRSLQTPINPSVGQAYTDESLNLTYLFNGDKWVTSFSPQQMS